mgnify:CR=1 FL=1
MQAIWTIEIYPSDDGYWGYLSGRGVRPERSGRHFRIPMTWMILARDGYVSWGRWETE